MADHVEPDTVRKEFSKVTMHEVAVAQDRPSQPMLRDTPTHFVVNVVEPVIRCTYRPRVLPAAVVKKQVAVGHDTWMPRSRLGTATLAVIAPPTQRAKSGSA